MSNSDFLDRIIDKSKKEASAKFYLGKVTSYPENGEGLSILIDGNKTATTGYKLPNNYIPKHDERVVIAEINGAKTIITGAIDTLQTMIPMTVSNADTLDGKHYSDLQGEFVKNTGDKIGSATDYTQFETDGTMIAVGNATCHLDELGDVTSIKITGVGITDNSSEGGIDFASNAYYNTDFVYANMQLNHDWKLGSSIEPHLHWFQNQNAIPNFLLEYRWQKQGEAQTSSWTKIKWSSNAFTYTSGTLNQITSFGNIIPPTGYGEVSDIIQFRIYRDTTNDSTEFTGVDTYTGSATVISFDIHKEVDMLGSKNRYSKD